MRILYAGQSLAEPGGGGELSASAMLRKLAVHHDVRVVGAASVDSRESSCKEIDVFNYALPAAEGVFLQSGHTEREARFREIICNHLIRFQPRLVLLQQPGFLHAGDLDKDTRLVMFIRSPLCFGCWDPNPVRWRRAVLSALTYKRFRKFQPLLQRADLIISNSNYMRDELLRKRHLESVNIPPLIEADEPSGQSVPSSRAFITLVGLDPWKGGELALKLAGAMPHRQFLFVTGNRASSELLAQAARLDNIELAGWTNDMSEHYRRTRLIIMPSHWAEPFGRVAVEAGRYQIPTIATATGGLPEAVGAGGILLPRAASKSDWIGAIESLDDEAQYNHLASLASEHSRRFSPERVFEKVDLAVRQHTGLDLFEGNVGSNTPAE